MKNSNQKPSVICYVRQTAYDVWQSVRAQWKAEDKKFEEKCRADLAVHLYGKGTYPWDGSR